MYITHLVFYVAQTTCLVMMLSNHEYFYSLFICFIIREISVLYLASGLKMEYPVYYQTS